MMTLMLLLLISTLLNNNTLLSSKALDKVGVDIFTSEYNSTVIEAVGLRVLKPSDTAHIVFSGDKYHVTDAGVLVIGDAINLTQYPDLELLRKDIGSYCDAYYDVNLDRFVVLEVANIEY